MAWSQLAIDKPHLVYIILGGFTSLFMLCSSIIKEKLYIGEATIATLCGIIFGPHAANLIDPGTWGNTDQITLEFARIVLVVQCFAVGVELPKAYMERHWRSVTFLLIPVMTFGWLITSLFVWALIPSLNWLDSLCVAACVTATDPVLASSVVGKGKFAKRVPKHLRDLLSAESGCNDGMAFPFIYLALYIIRYRHEPGTVTWHWIGITIFYECIFGAFYGVCVGYIARRAIRAAHERDLIDRESFLVFYFVLALFCAGSGSILGIDDLLVGFSCGVGFSNDGWFTEKTEETHVSNVIDLLINLAFFVYFGTIIPWAQFNSDVIGLSAWRLVVIGILVLLFRRIPVMLMLKPLIPDIKTWREALFAGHFGPIGVGAIFVAILARAELETGSTTPLAVLPDAGFEHDNIIELIWPVTTFLVICSIIVHGSSIAVFTLGKHINTLTLTMSYTTANEEGPSWMERLPRIQSRSKSSMSARRPDEESSMDEKIDYPPGMLPAGFLRRQREDDDSSRPQSKRRSRRGQWESGRGPGGPISQSAIAPQRDRSDQEKYPSRSDSETLNQQSSGEKEKSKPDEDTPDSPDEPEAAEIYEEGDKTVYEDEEGNVLAVEESNQNQTDEQREKFERKEAERLMSDEDVHHGVSRKEHSPGDPGPKAAHKVEEAGKDVEQAAEHPHKEWRRELKKMGHMPHLGGLRKKEDRDEERKEKPARSRPEPRRGPARAYQFGNTIIVEDEDGEVLKKYDIPSPEKKSKQQNKAGEGASGEPERPRHYLQRVGTAMSLTGRKKEQVEGEAKAQDKKRSKNTDDADDERLRFTISAGGRRMSKTEFIKQIQQLDPRARANFVEDSNVPEAVKQEARQDAQRGRHAIPKNLHSMPEHDGVEFPFFANAEDSDAAAIKKVSSNDDVATGPEGLTLIDSNDQDIPFHDVHGTIRDKQRTTGTESAAERRRREARERAQRSPRTPQQQQHRYAQDSDSEDDGTERIPPNRRRASPPPQDNADEEDSEDDGTERIPPPVSQQKRPQHSRRFGSDVEGETAAERRRREGALGVSKQESDSDEDESTPRQVPQSIRFAEPTRPKQQQQQQPEQGSSSGGSRLRWAKNVVHKS